MEAVEKDAVFSFTEFVLANCTREQAEEEERSLGPSMRLFLLK